MVGRGHYRHETLQTALKSGAIGLQEVVPPALKAGGILVRTRQQGLLAAYQKAMNKLDSLTPLGYSLAGEVVAVGEAVSELTIGSGFACPHETHDGRARCGLRVHCSGRSEQWAGRDGSDYRARSCPRSGARYERRRACYGFSITRQSSQRRSRGCFRRRARSLRAHALTVGSTWV